MKRGIKMKKATLILLGTLSFFVFNLQLVDAQAKAPWRYNQDFFRMGKKLESAPSLNGLEASDHRKLHLRIEIQRSDIDRIGLTEERIRAKCELRLRQAGLEPIPSTTPSGDSLEITVFIIGSAFHVEMQFIRDVLFEANGRSYYTTASTWQEGGTGTHGKDPEYIIRRLDECFDSFLNEYLKANVK